MAGREREVKTLKKILKKYGMTIEQTRKHRVIRNHDGQALYWFSSTPTCQHFAENTLSDLIKLGLVPLSEKNKKIR